MTRLVAIVTITVLRVKCHYYTEPLFDNISVSLQALFPMFSQLDFPQAISATAVDYNLRSKTCTI